MKLFQVLLVVTLHQTVTTKWWW